MDYLSEMCPIYECDRFNSGWVSERQHDEVVWDDGEECYVAIDNPSMVMKSSRERAAQWWCVAVYETDRAYGGPEEGGWWYDVGGLTEHAKIRFFDRYQDAYDYAQELWTYCLEENKDRGDVRLAPRGFTEQLPDVYFPKTRPYYS